MYMPEPGGAIMREISKGMLSPSYKSMPTEASGFHITGDLPGTVAHFDNPDSLHAKGGR